MTDRDYVLTEEIARQTVEVIFNLFGEEWFICFSNPTAGPWKLIRLWTPKGPREVSPYLKEDVRPDLVLQSFKSKILIYLEAKKHVTELLGQAQLQKSARMFQSEIGRFRRHLDDWEPDAEYLHLTGFVFPTNNPQIDLSTFHRALSQQHDFPGDHYVVFFVTQEPSKDLCLFWHVEALGTETGATSSVAKLQSSFPRAATQYLPLENDPAQVD